MLYANKNDITQNKKTDDTGEKKENWCMIITELV